MGHSFGYFGVTPGHYIRHEGGFFLPLLHNEVPKSTETGATISTFNPLVPDTRC